MARFGLRMYNATLIENVVLDCYHKFGSNRGQHCCSFAIERTKEKKKNKEKFGFG